MHKSLEDLKEVSDFIDKQRKSQDTKAGKNEAIPQIQQRRNRTETLEQQLQELAQQEKEMKLRIKILKKKDELVKIEQRLQTVSAEDKFYTEKPDGEGHIELRKEKWERDFQDLILKLEQIEQSQQQGVIDEPTATEAKANVSKDINKLVSVKKNTNSRNRMNSLKRGMNKVLKGVGSVSKGVNQISKELGSLSSMSGYSGKKSYGSDTNWESFFSDDKPKRTKSTKKSKKRKSTKRRKTTKKRKSPKKRKKSKSTKTTTTRSSSGMFGGF